MSGIFKYQVPGQNVQVNQRQQADFPTRPESNNFGSQKLPSALIFDQILVLVLRLIQEIQAQHSNNHQLPDISTRALGEEDGGQLPPIQDGPAKPPGVTTLAGGEEDDGQLPPPVQDGPAKPPGVTTLALGEEDGGLPPPIQDGPAKPNPDISTRALGEEDGGW